MEESLIFTPSFFTKFGQGAILKLKVLKPVDFESRKTQSANFGVSVLTENKSVLRDEDVDIEEELFVKNNMLAEDLEQAISGTVPKDCLRRKMKKGF